MSEVKKQASNIDEQGNVLYLDQERLDRKEVGFPPYKNRPNGLGIYNWLVEHAIYMNDKRWPLILKMYHIVVRFSVWMKQGGWTSPSLTKITAPVSSIRARATFSAARWRATSCAVR